MPKIARLEITSLEYVLAKGKGYGNARGVNNRRNCSLITLTTGRPYNITTGRDENGDTVSNDRPAGITRLKMATMTVGHRDAAPFFHCHALWREADGRIASLPYLCE